MSATTKSPGQDNLDGTLATQPRSRNRRINRYTAQAVGGGNKTARRHRSVDDITLAFVAPDQITDTANRMDQFRLGEFVEAEKSVAQDGPYEVATVVAGQLDMVEQTIGAEIAGPSILVKSLDNQVGGSRFN